MEKILTIVVPTYNMEKYLDKCLSSLIVDDRELMSRFEVLVIIDGATDKSSEIAHRYESNYSETFRVIDKENGNYGSCVNRGLKEATGKYIKVLDADDWFDTECFTQYLNTISSIDADLVLNDVDIIDEEGKILRQWAFSCKRNAIIDFRDCCCSINQIQMHMLTYKTNNLRAIHYKQTEGISYTDQEWNTYPLITVNTAMSLSLPLYKYLVGRTGQTIDSAVLYKNFKDIQKVIISLGVIWRNYVGEDWKKQMLYSRFEQQVLYNYIQHFYNHNFPDNEFHDFDHILVYSFPEIKKSIDSIAEIRFRISFRIVPLWRKKLLFVYNFFDSLAAIKASINRKFKWS